MVAAIDDKVGVDDAIFNSAFSCTANWAGVNAAELAPSRSNCSRNLVAGHPRMQKKNGPKWECGHQVRTEETSC